MKTLRAKNDSPTEGQSNPSSGKQAPDLKKKTHQKSWFWRPWRLVPALKKLKPMKRG